MNYPLFMRLNFAVDLSHNLSNYSYQYCSNLPKKTNQKHYDLLFFNLIWASFHLYFLVKHFLKTMEISTTLYSNS